MIHIVFNEPDIEVLKKAIELDSSLEGEVMLIRDDYAVGPLNNIYTPEGAAERKDWWRMIFAGSDQEGIVDEGKVNDEQVLIDIKEALVNDENE
jgi:hypothetical protein